MCFMGSRFKCFLKLNLNIHCRTSCATFRSEWLQANMKFQSLFRLFGMHSLHWPICENHVQLCKCPKRQWHASRFGDTSTFASLKGEDGTTWWLQASAWSIYEEFNSPTLWNSRQSRLAYLWELKLNRQWRASRFGNKSASSWAEDDGTLDGNNASYNYVVQDYVQVNHESWFKFALRFETDPRSPFSFQCRLCGIIRLAEFNPLRKEKLYSLNLFYHLWAKFLSKQNPATNTHNRRALDSHQCHESVTVHLLPWIFGNIKIWW